jgi:hypothetical protein
MVASAIWASGASIARIHVAGLEAVYPLPRWYWHWHWHWKPERADAHGLPVKLSFV